MLERFKPQLDTVSPVKNIKGTLRELKPLFLTIVLTPIFPAVGCGYTNRGQLVHDHGEKLTVDLGYGVNETYDPKKHGSIKEMIGEGQRVPGELDVGKKAPIHRHNGLYANGPWEYNLE